MEIKKVTLDKIKKQWNDMYSGNNMLSPYMSYDFQQIYKRKLWIGKSRFLAKYECYALYERDEIICLVPIIKKSDNSYIGGDLCATGQLDFVYRENMPLDELKNCVEVVKQSIGGKFHINKISENSKLCKALKECYEPASNESCVKIDLPDDYNIWFSGLSKSVRQNIRTAKNRMRREEKQCKFEIYNGRKVQGDDNKELMDVYNKRMEFKFGRKVGRLESLIRENMNPITSACNQLSNNFVAILRIDNEVAAFLSGLQNNGQTLLLVPRLAINDKYALYSPGSLLIAETNAYAIEQTNIRCVDLSRGNEKYKFAMGGVEHYNYSFQI